jgi:hypothetical protein
MENLSGYLGIYCELYQIGTMDLKGMNKECQTLMLAFL